MAQYVEVAIYIKLTFMTSAVTDTRLSRIIRETLDEIELFHGTTADFNNFDEAYISSGWGEQAYGYGFYLTTSRNTAEAYSRGGHVLKVEVPKGKYLSYRSISENDKRRIANLLFKWYTTEHEYGREAYSDTEARKYFWEDYITSILDSENGGDVYGNIAATIGSNKDTSKFLHRIGYVGIKIPCVNEDTKEKFWNYVIFDPKDIKIIEKNV